MKRKQQARRDDRRTKSNIKKHNRHQVNKETVKKSRFQKHNTPRDKQQRQPSHANKSQQEPNKTHATTRKQQKVQQAHVEKTQRLLIEEELKKASPNLQKCMEGASKLQSRGLKQRLKKRIQKLMGVQNSGESA